MSGLRLGPGDYVMYAVRHSRCRPERGPVRGMADILGPGFAVGTGTVVSPSVVALGPAPAFPLLAALPGSGPTSRVGLSVWLAVPVFVGAVGAVLAQRAYRVLAYDSAALRGFGCRLRRRGDHHPWRSRSREDRWAPAGWPTSVPRVWGGTGGRRDGDEHGRTGRRRGHCLVAAPLNAALSRP